MADASLWDDVLPIFQAIGSVTHGDTTRASTIAEMARHVLADAPERFILVGFSMGGRVAREIARIAPERVRALVLVATTARADTPRDARKREAAVKMADPKHFSGLSRPGVLLSLHPDRADDNGMIERVRAMSERVGADVFRRHALHFRESDLQQLADIRCPTLIIAADRDALRSVEEAEELRHGIDGSALRIIEGSGHMIPLEQPDALMRAIIPWLVEQPEGALAPIVSSAVLQSDWSELIRRPPIKRLLGVGTQRAPLFPNKKRGRFLRDASRQGGRLGS